MSELVVGAPAWEQTLGYATGYTIPALLATCSFCTRPGKGKLGCADDGAVLPLTCDLYARRLADVGSTEMCPPQEAGDGGFLDPLEVAEAVLHCLTQETCCFAAGVLLVERQRGQVVFMRCRPVHDLFLQAMQQRLVRNYQLHVGTALVQPEVQVVVYGDSVSGPYEPPRSVLTVPILLDGHAVGMLIIATIFPDAFDNGDLCTLSALAAHMSSALSVTRLVVPQYA